jgi:hypothetical protein
MNNQNSSFEIEGSIFKFLFSLFARYKVQCVLVGGYALIVNKVQRMTFDIDFIITADDFSKIEPEINKAGYSIFNRQESFVQFRSGKHGLRDIDFLISDKHTLEKLIAQGKKVSIAGESFIVPSPKHLITMKLHSIAGNSKRELKDFPDIVQLMTANTIDPTGNDIKEIFEKYNLMDIYKRVVEAVGVKNGKRKRK